MFRFAIAALAVVGLISLFFGGASAAATGAGFLFLFPVLLVFKILFVMLFFGFIGRGFGRRGPYRPGAPWGRWERPESREQTTRNRTDDFEEWHRMAHAKEEVDRWVDDVGDVDPDGR